MKKVTIYILLTCFLSLAFAQQKESSQKAGSQVAIVPGQPINFPIEAFIAEKEGVVIYRIFWDENNQYKRHQQLYASHQELADGVEGIIPELRFAVPQHASGSYQIIAPFIFEMEDGEGEARSHEILMQDGNACMELGLSHIALHFYDQMLTQRRKKDRNFFELHQARRAAFLHSKNWEDARQEVTHMLAYARETKSSYADQQMVLRIDRIVLSLLSEKSTQAIADLSWLNRQEETDISLLSTSLYELKLTRKEAHILALEADNLQENLPQKTKFWLHGIAAVSLSSAHSQTQAYSRFTTLLEQESNPEFQGALLCQMGWSLYNQGKPVEALAQLQEATQLSPELAQAHFYKALSLVRLEYTTEAYESMHDALELGLPTEEQQVQGQQMLAILAVSGRR